VTVARQESSSPRWWQQMRVLFGSARRTDQNVQTILGRTLTPDQLALSIYAIVRAALAEQPQEQSLREISTFVTDATSVAVREELPEALAGLDPETIVSAVLDGLGPDGAGQVRDHLAARLEDEG
jgi:hypothetical protein